MTATEYIANIRSALKSNAGAREFYFPANRDKRKTMNLRLAREVGYGLKPFDYQDLGCLYSLLVVSFSFDSTGVAIDAKEFLDELLRSRDAP